MGKLCLATRIDSVHNLFALGLAIGPVLANKFSDDPGEYTYFAENVDVRTDNLGKGIVVYFPGIKWK